MGIAAFTPQADFSKPPDNPINFDDGRENVRDTLPPFKDLLYGHAYVLGSLQKDAFNGGLKVGFTRQRLET